MNKLIGHIALLALTGSILAGCGKNELISPEYTGGHKADSVEIRFDNGYIDNPVNTRGTTLLSDHMHTMGVWAWYTTNQDPEDCLFLNQCVTFDTNINKWSYSPKKYWSNRSSYIFNAYAPHSTEANGQTVTIDRATRHFSISSVTLKGDNTMIGLRMANPLGHFNNVDDIDWMIDRIGQDISGAYGNEVSFNMQHILAKLCVIADLDNDQGISVTIDSLEIGEFISRGDFTQTSDKTGEWVLDTERKHYTIKSENNLQITSQQCIVESLIFPQITGADQALCVHYTIGDNSHFTAEFKLNEIFSSFRTGNNYLIYLTMGPKVIRFDGGVSEWSDNEVHHYINN